MGAILPVAIFGLIGILCRYGIDQVFAEKNANFPISTLLINLLGCILAGVIYAVGGKASITPTLQTGLLVGFCGGFTTFSAYALQTFTMLEKGRILPGLLYVSLSPALGLMLIFTMVNLLRKF